MQRSRIVSIVTSAAVGVTLAAGVSPASAVTPVKPCPAKAGTLAKDPSGTGRAWHRGTSLYACTTVYNHAPKTKRMGPYAAGTRVAFDGVNVAWTVRMTKEGRRTDRVWAANVDSGKRWMLAQKPNPGGADRAAREVLVQRLMIKGGVVAWVTKGSDVVAALREPLGDPTVIGTLPAPPVRQGRIVEIGSFPATPAALLGRTLRITEGQGDGDECGGAYAVRITVAPRADGADAGVGADVGWTSTNCD